MPQETALPTPTPTEASLHCSPDDKPLITEQISFKGIYAGRTARMETRAILGEPSDVYYAEHIGLQWTYEGLDPPFFAITFKENIVSLIWLGWGDLPLRDLLEIYGCPDILTYPKDVSGFDMASREWVDLVYLDAGIVFNYPFTLSPDVDVHTVTYFPTMSREEFFQQNPSLESEDLMTWDMFYVHCPKSYGDCLSP